MATAMGRKFHESSGPPRTNFWIHYCKLSTWCTYWTPNTLQGFSPMRPSHGDTLVENVPLVLTFLYLGGSCNLCGIGGLARLCFFTLSVGVSTQHPLSSAVQILQPSFSVNWITSLCLHFLAGDQGLNYKVK